MIKKKNSSNDLCTLPSSSMRIASYNNIDKPEHQIMKKNHCLFENKNLSDDSYSDNLRFKMPLKS